MRAKLETQMGVVGTVALAFAVVALYALWGASLLRAERQAASQDPASHLSAVR